MNNLIWISKLIKTQKRAKIIRKQKNLSYKSPLKKCTKIIKLKKITFQYCTTYYKHTSYICLFSMNSFFFVRTIKMPKMAKKNTSLYDKNIRLQKLVANQLDSSAFALLFTEISVVWITEISVKSSAKAEESSLSHFHNPIRTCQKFC